MANAPVPHLLILEPDTRGHVREWLHHLIAGVQAAGPDALRLTIAVPDGLAAEIEHNLPSGPHRQHVQALRLSRREVSLCLHRKLWISGMSRWAVMRRCLQRAGATHGLFLEMDHLSLPLALGLGAGKRPLSGILFRPSVHYHALGNYSPNWRERLRDARKSLLYRLMLRNRSVGAVLTLDPYFVDYAARHYANADKLERTPDPVCPPVPPDGDDYGLAGRVPDGRKLFLLFGEMTERKGILTLLESLMGLPEGAAARVAVVAAGAVDPPILAAVDAAVARLARCQPSLWLHVENRRLSVGEITALLHRSDVVLAPYHRFVGSSGILLWAAQAQRPVLSQDYGLVGRLVREFRLGVGVDTTNARLLSETIGVIAQDYVPMKIDRDAMVEFCAARSPARFARIVLSQALCGYFDTNIGVAGTGPKALP